MPSEPRYVVFVGNCQISFLRNVFESLPEYQERFTSIWFRNFAEERPSANWHSDAVRGQTPEAFVASNRDRIAAVLRQTTHNWAGDPIEPSMLPRGSDFVDFPLCVLNYLWPLTLWDLGRLSEVSDPYVARRFPFTTHDRLVSKLVAKGATTETIVDEYLSHDLNSIVRLDRLREYNVAKLRSIDEAATFPLFDHVEPLITERQTYRTLNHPTGSVLVELGLRILDHISFLDDKEAARAALLAKRDGPGIQNFDTPLHPQLVQHFKLDWARDHAWEFWDEGPITFEGYLRKLVTFEYDTSYRDGLEAQRRGDTATALACFARAVDRVPASRVYRTALATLLLREQRYEDAAVRFAELYASSASNAHARTALRLWVRAGAFNAAEAFVEANPRLADDPQIAFADALHLPAARSSVRAGRNAEAARHYLAAWRASGSPEAGASALREWVRMKEFGAAERALHEEPALREAIGGEVAALLHAPAARWFSGQRLHEEAARHYAALWHQTRADEDALLALREWTRNKNYAAAEAFWTQNASALAALAPSVVQLVHRPAAQALSEAGRLADAAEEHAKAYRAVKDVKHALTALRHWIRDGEFDRAERFWRSTPDLRDHPDVPIAHILFLPAARRRLGEGRNEEAIAHLKTAVEAEPDVPEHRLLLANTLVRLDRRADAIQHLRAAWERDPRLDVGTSLARNLMVFGEIREAATVIAALSRRADGAADDDIHVMRQRCIGLARRAGVSLGTLLDAKPTADFGASHG